MKRISYLYIIMCICCAFATAQTNTQNAIQEINQIKRSGDDYFFAEATSQTWEEALENAKTLLSAQIELWAKTEPSDETVEVYVARASEHLFEIKATRGQLFRAFVYVKKSAILALSSTDDVLVVPVNKEETPVVTLVTPVQEESVRSEINETPAEKEQQIVAEYTVPEPPQKQPSPNPEKELYQLTPFEREMLSVSSFNNVSDFIRNLQGSNKIGKLGKYADMPHDIECYLFVYNQQGEIPAHLHKTSDGFFNLKTKQADDIKNYKGCGALWFSLR